jgi:CheY-like chemotaxis protein
MRILVVDDNQDAARCLEELLELRGHIAFAAFSSEQALRIAPRFRPDLALLDLGLPGMDGIELCERLRQLPGLSRTRFLALTGHDRRAIRERAAAVGFVLYLVKPVSLAQLETILGSLGRGVDGPVLSGSREERGA